MKEELELRMYGMTPYQLTGIQSGIQFSHGLVRYGQLVKKLIKKYPNSDRILEMEKNYDEWADKWQTVIVLNGGTTNKSVTHPGSMNTGLDELKKNSVELAEFYEPDLGDQLTAVVFIVDERVFNEEKFPTFVKYVYKNGSKDFITEAKNSYGNFKYEDFKTSDKLDELKMAKEWRDMLGGDKNVFLRGFLKNYRLA